MAPGTFKSKTGATDDSHASVLLYGFDAACQGEVFGPNARSGMEADATVTIEKVAADGTYSGTIDATFEGAYRLVGRFESSACASLPTDLDSGALRQCR